MRANHPAQPRALWIRYTIFSPHGSPGAAVGELWAIHFDATRDRNVAVTCEVPLSQCRFAPDAFDIRVGEAVLDDRHLHGSAATGSHRLSWELGYAGDAPPLTLLDPSLYEARFPKAKAVAAQPRIELRGHLEVDGERVEVDGWVGSQNHNWGSAHTDEYAWGQVVGFDDAPESILEVATARLKLGPVWTPRLTPIALRHRGRDHVLGTIRQSLRNRGSFEPFAWWFRGENDDVRIDGEMSAPRSAFVGLPYRNPPGGIKQCLNSKIATCRVVVVDKASGDRDVLSTDHRAAFEIVGDRTDHGVPVLDTTG